jgi:enoyl-CoA hydratase
MMSGSSARAEGIRSEQRGAVRVLTLDRSDKLNAANLEMQQSLRARVEELASDDTVRAAVLTGAGQAFCAGGDLDMLLRANDDAELRAELSRNHRSLLRALLTLPIPVVAAVNGPAVGFGAELAALCDMVVMGRDAYLCDPHVHLGLPPSPGCQLVWPHLASRAVAKELLLTGRRVDAHEALRLGLVNRVVESGTELAAALEIADELAGMPATGIVAAKASFNAPLLEEATRLQELITW